MLPLDAQSIEERFAASEPSRRELYLLYALVMAIIVTLMVLPTYGDRLGVPNAAGVLLLVVLVVLLASVGYSVGRRQRQCRSRIIAAWEHAKLGQWGQAAPILDGLLRGPIRSPADRAEAFLLLAAALENVERHDLAGQVYETLAFQRIGTPTQVHQAQIALAASKIRTQELTDAVNLLAHLEAVQMPEGLRAALDLARLFQQVFMGHCDDAIQDLPKRRELFRRQLSTQAAYGYGLLAAAMHGLGRREEASQLWRDATTLIAADKLVKEYSCLVPIARGYPPMERPL